jgi:hypothetical protein
MLCKIDQILSLLVSHHLYSIDVTNHGIAKLSWLCRGRLCVLYVFSVGSLGLCTDYSVQQVLGYLFPEPQDIKIRSLLT